MCMMMLNVEMIMVAMLLQVKVVRETMNRALDMWKEVTDDASEDASSPAKSACSSVGKCIKLMLLFK